MDAVCRSGSGVGWSLAAARVSQAVSAKKKCSKWRRTRDGMREQSILQPIRRLQEGNENRARPQLR